MNEYAANALLVVLSVLIVLSGLEAALSMGLVERPVYWDVERHERTCEQLPHDRPEEHPDFHPKYGWTQVPNHVFERKLTPGQEWERHVIGEDGFRRTANTGDQDVIVVGDSFTYGILASDDETYPGLLDRWNPNVAVHNLGMPGYGPQQYYLTYEDKAEEIDHDLVVVGLFLGNDVRDTINGDRPARPLFNVSDGELRQTREPEPGRYPVYQGPRNWDPERAYSGMIALFEGIHRIAAENDAEVLVVTLPPKAPPNPVTREAKRRVDRFAANESTVHALDSKPVLDRAQDDGDRVYGYYDGHLDDYGYFLVADRIQSWLAENDDETGLEVTTSSGDPPERGVLSAATAPLRSSTESYSFLATRTRLAGYKLVRPFGFVTGGTPCR